jgi:solute carrier family 25 carnitine/acylcarnitine transporter 20/29
VEEDKKPKYFNMRNAFKTIFREEGYRVFFAGLGATAIRAFPTNAATFYVVVLSRNFMHDQLGLQ